MEQIAKELGINPKAVERWIAFIHTLPNYIKNKPSPEENIVKEIIEKYQQYLSSDTLEQEGLHFSISKSFSNTITKNQIHKILVTYRQELRQKFFDKYHSKTNQSKLISTIDSECTDD